MALFRWEWNLNQLYLFLHLTTQAHSTLVHILQNNSMTTRFDLQETMNNVMICLHTSLNAHKATLSTVAFTKGTRELPRKYSTFQIIPQCLKG